jgi:cholesterol transport system auxiliary component
MKQRLQTLIVCAATGVLAAMLAACAPPQLNRPAPERKLYNISAERPEAAAPLKARTALKVRPLQISPAFQGKELVYRLGDTQFESDYYNAFFVQPSQNLTGQTRQWLSRAGLFGNVVDSTSQVQDTHLLEGMVNAFYGDFRDKGAPKAVLEVQFFLVQNQGDNYNVIFEKNYAKAVAFEPQGGDASALALAYNQALAQTLAELEKDLRAALTASK